ncbi:hypothetical protein E6O75_ATG10045 [Venturia nashicola]|uniref:Uncharacterized protein n=1 Tax=Venturia nashicola TaxID=86259 RepID=A0A4Z1NCN7_9PEZI|nr:hypothetical protein E6O75_ATG10045 [Venturia nashicola]
MSPTPTTTVLQTLKSHIIRDLTLLHNPSPNSLSSSTTPPPKITFETITTTSSTFIITFISNGQKEVLREESKFARSPAATVEKAWFELYRVVAGKAGWIHGGDWERDVVGEGGVVGQVWRADLADVGKGEEGGEVWVLAALLMRMWDKQKPLRVVNYYSQIVVDVCACGCRERHAGFQPALRRGTFVYSIAVEPSYMDSIAVVPSYTALPWYLRTQHCVDFVHTLNPTVSASPCLRQFIHILLCKLRTASLRSTRFVAEFDLNTSSSSYTIFSFRPFSLSHLTVVS